MRKDTRAGFVVLMEATKYCSLVQLTDAMFGVGGAVSAEYEGGVSVPARRLAVGHFLQVLGRITGLWAFRSNT